MFFSLDDYPHYIMLSEQEKEFELGKELEYKVAKDPKAFRAQQTKPVKKAGGHHLSSTSYNVPIFYLESGRRNQVMICENRKYIQNNKYGKKIYWKCSKWHDGCKARAITLLSDPNCIIRRNEHNHPENPHEKDEEKESVME